MFTPRWTTAEGIEAQFGVCHIGHFLLTTLLLDTLKASAPSRIVIVSSSAYRMTSGLSHTDLNMEKSYSKYRAYGQAKLANILFAHELTKRLAGTGVTANSLHPGAVKTELARNQPLMRIIMYPMYWFFKTAKKGAQTSLTLALDPDLEKVSGKFFKDCRPTSLTSAAKSDEEAAWLWQVSKELTVQQP